MLNNDTQTSDAVTEAKQAQQDTTVLLQVTQRQLDTLHVSVCMHMQNTARLMEYAISKRESTTALDARMQTLEELSDMMSDIEVSLI